MRLYSKIPVEVHVLGFLPVIHEDGGSAGLKKPPDFPGEKVGLADTGRHAEQGHDKVELLSWLGPVILERGSDQTAAEFGMLVSEDTEHPSTGIDPGIVLQTDVPEAEVDERPGAAADVENIGPGPDLQSIVYPPAPLDVGFALVDREVVRIGNAA